MKVAEENDPAGERAEDRAQRPTVREAVSELNQPRPCIDRRMVDQHERGALLHEGVRQDPFERLALRSADVAAGHEGRARNGAREGDDRDRAAKLHAREMPNGELACELRKVALEERPEV